MGMMLGDTFLQAIVIGAVSFGLSYVYFRLLDYFQGTGTFWIVLVLGLFIGFV